MRMHQRIDVGQEACPSTPVRCESVVCHVFQHAAAPLDVELETPCDIGSKVKVVRITHHDAAKL